MCFDRLTRFGGYRRFRWRNRANGGQSNARQSAVNTCAGWLWHVGGVAGEGGRVRRYCPGEQLVVRYCQPVATAVRGPRAERE